jgi:hypothetical protein
MNLEGWRRMRAGLVVYGLGGNGNMMNFADII